MDDGLLGVMHMREYDKVPQGPRSTVEEVTAPI